MLIPNLLIIAGTGTKSGKTSMACKIIEQFNKISIIAIKISPHYHETTSGLIAKSEKEGYSIYEETDKNTSKDTSRMLHSGATKVYFAKVWDNELLDVFNEIMKYIPVNMPIICESPALRNFVEPGVFIIMSSETTNKLKNISHFQALPHVMYKLEELNDVRSLPIEFENGKWRLF